LVRSENFQTFYFSFFPFLVTVPVAALELLQQHYNNKQQI